MAHIRHAVIAFALAGLTGLVGCGAKESAMNQLPEISATITKQLAFVCTHERASIPVRDPEAEQLYRHARWLVKNNILKQDPLVYPAIERLIRIATAYGHDKANIELRDMLEKGRAVSPDPVNETIDLVQDLIKRGIPAGYYDMGWYLDHGFGVRADQELAFKYYRKSADMGSPQGQFWVGSKLADQSKYGKEVSAIGNAMRRCAADQGHAESATRYALQLQVTGQLAEATKYFQISAAAGSALGSSSLADAFSERDHANPDYGLGQAVDIERQDRYKKVQRFLSDYEYLTPKVPEIDRIVPLPPAKLPPWDGKFIWLEEHKANAAPTLPAAERIAEMARTKGLDPNTGRPASK